MIHFKVNGVRVSCADCVYFDLKPDETPCDRCFPVVYHHIGDVKDVAFLPADIKKFKRLEAAVKQYRPKLTEIKQELKEYGIDSLDEFVKRARDVKKDISVERCFDTDEGD